MSKCVHLCVCACVRVCMCKLISVALISSSPLVPVVCYTVLQCVAVRCSVLQCISVRCSALQCAAVCCNVSQYVAVLISTTFESKKTNFTSNPTHFNHNQQSFHSSSSLPLPPSLLCVAVCCSVLQCATVCAAGCSGHLFRFPCPPSVPVS